MKPHYQVSDYQYVLPGTQTNNLTVRLTGGTLHGKALAGKEIPLSKNATALLRNESYTLNVTLRTKDLLYLYQDGTVGYWGDHSAARVPIAVVVRDKTSTEKGLAVALKDDGKQYTVGDFSSQYYYYFIETSDKTLENMDGYDITHTTNYYSEGNMAYQGFPKPTVSPAEAMHISKTPQEPLLYTYYHAAHHNPGVNVTGTNVGKWFLPSSGQWLLAIIRLGNFDLTNLPTSPGSIDFFPNNRSEWKPWDGTAAATVFTQAGGTLPLNKPYALSGVILFNESLLLD